MRTVLKCLEEALFMGLITCCYIALQYAASIAAVGVRPAICVSLFFVVSAVKQLTDSCSEMT